MRRCLAIFVVAVLGGCSLLSDDAPPPPPPTLALGPIVGVSIPMADLMRSAIGKELQSLGLSPALGQNPTHRLDGAVEGLSSGTGGFATLVRWRLSDAEGDAVRTWEHVMPGPRWKWESRTHLLIPKHWIHW